MTDQLPERIWAEPQSSYDLGGYYWPREDDAEKTTLFLRADTAIPRSQADSMVAAVVDSCAEVLEECGIDGSAFAQTFEEYRRGRAAFEQAVQEAVEAERERWSGISRENYDAFCAMRNDINEIVGDMPSAESALKHGPELSHEMQQVVESVARFAAAIRAPQETSE